MSRKTWILVGVIACALGLAFAGCAPGRPQPKDFKEQYDKVTPGIDLQKLMTIVAGFGRVEKADANSEVILNVAIGEQGVIVKATFTMQDGKVVSKNWEETKIPPAPAGMEGGPGAVPAGPPAKETE